MAYAFIAMAAAFGGVSAFVLLSPKPPPAPPPAAAPQQAPPQMGPLEAAPPPPPDESTLAPAEQAAASTRTVAPPGGPLGQRPQDRPAASAVPIDTSGSSSPAAPSGAGAAGGGLRELSQAEIEAIVRKNQPGVRHRCWQQALDSRAGTGPTTVRVSAQIVIGPSGAVQSATAGGAENEFPGLSSCIAARLKAWSFPPSSGSTPVKIPFVFAAQ
jgi:hypothetical protein